MKPGKSWTEKLHAEDEPAVKPSPVDIAGMKKGQPMLIPNPRMVDAFIRSIPEGTAVSVPEMRLHLAERHGAEVTCPVTTGYHLRTVAEAAYESLEAGADLSEITPIWRVLDRRTPTTKKLSFDPGFIADQRQREGLPA